MTTVEVRDADIESKANRTSIIKKPSEYRKTMLSEASESKKADQFVIFDDDVDDSDEEDKMRISAGNEQLPGINI